MKITFFIGAISGGGAERVVCELSSYLAQKGHQVEILVATSVESNYPLDKRVSISCLDAGRGEGLRLFSKPRQLIKLIVLHNYLRRTKTDGFVVFLPHITRALFLFRKTIRRPIIMSERNCPEVYPKEVQKYIVNCAEMADGIVFQTENAKAFYEANCKKLPLNSIIPNAVSAEIAERVWHRKEKVIVGIGRLSAQKNFTLLVRSFAAVVKRLPDYKLIIYGEGPKLNELQDLVEKLDLRGKVSFPGYVKDVNQFVQRAAVFVMSSNYEGMPNALIEAMAMGVPCVATDCDGGGAAFLIKNNINGFLIPKNDAEAMSEAICKIIEDNETAARISAEARKINEDLSQKCVYDKWESFLNKTITCYDGGRS